MARWAGLAIAVLTLSLAACGTPDRTSTVAEQGIGGTGQVAEQGIGGTGQVAEQGIGGTGQVAEQGIGGTGQVAEQGIGGTGQVAEQGIGGIGQVAEQGIGGTGQVADRGIGGTGIVGTLTAFGSIWINGLEVTVPADLSVTLGDQSRPAEVLALGQMLQVLADSDGSALVARDIAIRFVAVGPVTAVAGDRVTILDQTVILPDGTTAPAVGDWLGVSGLRRPDGVIVAGWVTPRPAGHWRLVGPVTATDDGGRRVGGFPVAPGFAPGTRLALSGPWTANGPRVSAVRPVPENPFGLRVRRLVIETWLDRDGASIGGAAPDRTQGGRVVIDAVPGRHGRPAVRGVHPAPTVGATRGAAPPPGGGKSPPGGGKPPPGGGKPGGGGGAPPPGRSDLGAPNPGAPIGQLPAFGPRGPDGFHDDNVNTPPAPGRPPDGFSDDMGGRPPPGRSLPSGGGGKPPPGPPK